MRPSCVDAIINVIERHSDPSRFRNRLAIGCLCLYLLLAVFFPEIGEVGFFSTYTRVSVPKKTTFLSNRPATCGRTGSLDLGEGK